MLLARSSLPTALNWQMTQTCTSVNIGTSCKRVFLSVLSHQSYHHSALDVFGTLEHDPSVGENLWECTWCKTWTWVCRNRFHPVPNTLGHFSWRQAWSETKSPFISWLRCRNNSILLEKNEHLTPLETPDLAEMVSRSTLHVLRVILAETDLVCMFFFSC